MRNIIFKIGWYFRLISFYKWGLVSFNDAINLLIYLNYQKWVFEWDYLKHIIIIKHRVSLSDIIEVLGYFHSNKVVVKMKKVEFMRIFANCMDTGFSPYGFYLWFKNNQ